MFSYILYLRIRSICTSIKKLMDGAVLLFILISIETSWKMEPVDGDKGQAIGPLQIHSGVVFDVNQAFREGIAQYTHENMRNRAYAGWVCLKYMELYRAKSYEEAARLWKGGPGWRNEPEKTDAYWNDFKDRLKKLNLDQYGNRIKAD